MLAVVSVIGSGATAFVVVDVLAPASDGEEVEGAVFGRDCFALVCLVVDLAELLGVVTG